MHSFVIAAAKLHNIATGQWILESESVTIIVTFLLPIPRYKLTKVVTKKIRFRGKKRTTR